jgi:DNA-directed RNA polymerase subunit L
MSLISNLKIEDESIKFDLNNNTSQNIKISFANALRCILISEIKTYIIDYKSIVFFDPYEDDRILNYEFLKDRLYLIPIISDLDLDYENIVITCKKENQDEHIQSVYVNDFICKNRLTNEIIDNNVLFKYPDILFTKLRNGNKISFECGLIKDCASFKGSKYSAHSAVAACGYRFKIDDNLVNEMIKSMDEKQKNSFLTQDVERYYLKNNKGEPAVFQFQFESIGFYDCKTILNMGLNIFVDNINIIKNEINNLNGDKINYLEEDEQEDFFKFFIDQISDFEGNLLSTYISSHPNVFYSGYINNHPLKKNIILKIKLNKDNNLNQVIITIKEVCDNILTILYQLIDELKKQK